MTHTEALNLILASACPSDDLTGDVRTFSLSLHCVEVEVRAVLVSTMDSIQYEVESVTFL